jgi:hypothetical protein
MKILMCWLDMERPVARIDLAQVTKTEYIDSNPDGRF